MSSPNSSTEPEILFTTLGMFILDEIHPLPPASPQFNIIGGGGTYSALGARLFCPPPLSKSVGWIVDTGDDFPDEVRKTVNEWETGCIMRKREGCTTRGWNGYLEREVRAFRYTTPKLRLDAPDLTPRLLTSKSFHLICSPTRCMSMVDNILSARSALPSPPPQRSIFVWEPVPDLCIPSELEACKRACKVVDVISPNDEELLSFFGEEIRDEYKRKTAVEQCVEELLKHGIGVGGSGSIVVRAGKEGCYVARLSLDSNVISRWLPPYYTDGSKVVDPTGGGNGFLGGFAVGLVRSEGDNDMDILIEAANYGSVAASFCIEQVGVPKVEKTGEMKSERWNESDVMQRLKEFKLRVKQ